MAKKYIVTLSTEEREALQKLIASGIARARKLTHARILLKADEGWEDQAINEALDVSIPTIERVRQTFVEEGLEAALNRRPPTREYKHKLDGEKEAHLIALSCSAPPEGHQRWTLRLLADKMVGLEYVESVSHETVRQVLSKNELKPWQKKEWCIPPEANAEFVYHMEDVLDVYKRPTDPANPIVCFDETPVQMVSETRQPLPAQPGQPERYDYEYRREESVAELGIWGHEGHFGGHFRWSYLSVGPSTNLAALQLGLSLCFGGVLPLKHVGSPPW
jgi:transposase